MYSQSDLVDDTDPGWRRSHPNVKGVTRPSGESFSASYDESDPNRVLSLNGEEEILRSVVASYGKSGNPGQFEIRSSSPNRFEVIGVNGHGESVLDALIDLPQKERRGDQAIEDISTALSQKKGRQVALFSLPLNLLIRVNVNIGGSGITARTLMSQVLDATQRPFYWDILYDADPNLFAVNIYPVTKAYYDVFGRRFLVDVNGDKR